MCERERLRIVGYIAVSTRAAHLSSETLTNELYSVAAPHSSLPPPPSPPQCSNTPTSTTQNDTMASAMATKRLRKEYLALQRKPVENIIAVPQDSNILEWHYVITGTSGSPYEGGHYHGCLKFPPEYPMKPPSVYMTTPNGRFKTNQRLCLSMSDFHPETWNPMWSVSSILTGLYSFMVRRPWKIRLCVHACRLWHRGGRTDVNVHTCP